LQGNPIHFAGLSTLVTSASNAIRPATVTRSESAEVLFVYTGASTQEQFQGIPTIHVGNISFPREGIYEMRVSGADATTGDFSTTFRFDSDFATGFGISVPSLGLYTIGYNSSDGSSWGCLAYARSAMFAALSDKDPFYPLIETLGQFRLVRHRQHIYFH
jgi:hypothetical protein